MDYSKARIEFITRLTENNDFSLENMFKLLRARGFLVEWVNGEIILSDNACLPADLEVLKSKLAESKLGEVRDNKIIFYNQQSPEKWLPLFECTGGGEALCPPYAKKWKYYSKREHGWKVETIILDPFIAYFVKAVSAIGVLTYNSCDGHARSKPSVYMCDRYSTAFLRAVMELFIDREVQINSWWFINSKSFSIYFVNSPFMPVDLFYDIYLVSDKIYENRIMLRQIRKYTIQEMEKHNPEKLADCDIEKLTFQAFNDYRNKHLL